MAGLPYTFADRVAREWRASHTWGAPSTSETSTPSPYYKTGSEAEMLHAIRHGLPETALLDDTRFFAREAADAMEREAAALLASDLKLTIEARVALARALDQAAALRRAAKEPS